jgi:mannosyl-glycoprotein endo-beta-N-acetylglucosaminidase
MLLADGTILDLMPTFTGGAHALHDALLPVTLLLCGTGIIIRGVQAYHAQRLGAVMPVLIRMGCIALLAGSLGDIGNTVNGIVTGLLQSTGFAANGFNTGNVFQDYLAAVAKKFGSDGAGQTGQTQAPTTAPNSYTGAGQNTQLGGLLAGNEANFAAAGAANGVDPLFLEAIAMVETGNGTSHALQAYNNPAGLMDPSTPNDTGFFKYATLQDGINAEASTLQANYISQGLTTISAIGAKYAPAGAINDVGGTNADWANEVSAAYQNLGGTSMSMGTAQATTTGNNSILGGWISKLGDSLTVALLGPFTYVLSLVALACMWIMTGVQNVLYVVEVALSPLFIGCLLVPALVTIASRFLSLLVGLCLWPVGWLVSDMITKALIDLAINPTNSLSQTVGFSGVAGLYGIWIVLAIFVIGSSFLAPLIVSASVMAGATGLGAVLAGTLGATAAAANTASNLGYRAAVAGASAARLGSGGNGSTAPVNAARPNYALRPPPKP